jgi:hypothetical protein
MAIIGGERPSTIQTTLASMQEEDDKQAIKVRNADLEARFVPPLPIRISRLSHHKHRSPACAQKPLPQSDAKIPNHCVMAPAMRRCLQCARNVKDGSVVG